MLVVLSLSVRIILNPRDAQAKEEEKKKKKENKSDKKRMSMHASSSLPAAFNLLFSVFYDDQ